MQAGETDPLGSIASSRKTNTAVPKLSGPG